MFRSVSRPFFSWYSIGSACSARYFHQVTTDFINYDARGNPVARKVPIIIGNPGEAYILIDSGVGSALCAASPFTSASASRAEDRCKLMVSHNTQHFGFDSSYPRLCPLPITLPDRVKSEPCNFVLEWENA
ncbi:hypothetical protein V6000_008747 [Aspergillus fumigatus]